MAVTYFTSSNFFVRAVFHGARIFDGIKILLSNINRDNERIMCPEIFVFSHLGI